jgi:hypothetical protein
MAYVTSAPLPVSIRIFLADGVPEGLRVVEKSNWTGLAVMSSRLQYPDIRGRDEFSRPGVYLLVGPSEETGGVQKIYVGVGDASRPRLDSHLSNKDFWTHLILFTSKDGNLNTSHFRYIESRLVSLGNGAKRAEVENGTAPNLPQLAEADSADAEAFLADMLLIYPVLVVQAFELVPEPSLPSKRVYLSGLDAQGQGEQTPDGFVVFEGSFARKDAVPSIPSSVEVTRDALKVQGILVEDGSNLRFTQNYVFNSPSSAASVFLARSANGRTEWKDSQGRTLNEIAQDEIVESESELTSG